MKNRVMLSTMNRLLLDDLLFYIIYVGGIIVESEKIFEISLDLNS